MCMTQERPLCASLPDRQPLVVIVIVALLVVGTGFGAAGSEDDCCSADCLRALPIEDLEALVGELDWLADRIEDAEAVGSMDYLTALEYMQSSILAITGEEGATHSVGEVLGALGGTLIQHLSAAWAVAVTVPKVALLAVQAIAIEVSISEVEGDPSLNRSGVLYREPGSTNLITGVVHGTTEYEAGSVSTADYFFVADDVWDCLHRAERVWKQRHCETTYDARLYMGRQHSYIGDTLDEVVDIFVYVNRPAVDFWIIETTPDGKTIQLPMGGSLDAGWHSMQTLFPPPPGARIGGPPGWGSIELTVVFWYDEIEGCSKSDTLKYEVRER